MQAVVKTARGEGNVALRELPVPRPGPGQVLLAVRAAGICGTDLHIYHDEYPTQPPVVLGHELAGEVASRGDGVTRVAPGDRVTTETYFHLCGICRFCRGGQPNLCPERLSIGSGVNGGFAPYVIVPERNVHSLPEGLSFREGALTEPLACVVHGALELPNVTAGDVAVIAGPGTIGLLTVQVVLAAGATVIVLGTSADRRRLELARELGAVRAIDITTEDAAPIVAELSGGWGADIVYECSGAGPAALELLTHVRRGGQYAQIGLFGKPVAWDLDRVCMKELRVTGSNATVPSTWRTALRLLADGRVKTAPLISDVFPLADWESAFHRFERREGMKLLLEP
ncbi:MAG: zinc-binding dehydrogenase [Chloroflexia bacterium]|nr:zinc-binding dehydrogenase [Chloroflexia bacterium]